MIDTLDDLLATARSSTPADPEVAAALLALAAARGAEAKRKARHRFVIPSVAAGAVLAFTGAGAVAASQWGPWNIADPDLVIAHEWVDTTGTYLGSCETRIATANLSPEARDAARAFLASLDVASIGPDPEMVAAELTAVGRPDDLGRLVPGADISDFNVIHTGPQWPDEGHSDAEILQHALTRAVGFKLMLELTGRYPELGDLGLETNEHTQCSANGAGGGSE